MLSELTILVPVYNEERTLVSIMTALAEKCPDAQIIYIDDGSKDRSLTMLHSYARPQDIVLTKPNGGKGSAIRMGLDNAKSTYTVIQDADLEYDPAQIAELLSEAKQHPGTAVFGSRFLQPNPNIYKRFLLGNKVMTLCLNLLYGSRVTDSYTCYKLLPTKDFQALNLISRGFELEAEICAKCIKRGIKIREIPITYQPRTIEEGKKINANDAWKGMVTMLKLRLRK
jgi:glycosyltransferase involved in cell wall biosynthesis